MTDRQTKSFTVTLPLDDSRRDYEAHEWAHQQQMDFDYDFDFFRDDTPTVNFRFENDGEAFMFKMRWCG